MSSDVVYRMPLMTSQTPGDTPLTLSALTDPTRLALYEFVAAAAEPVGRDAAADAVGIARQTAAYHLDRLAEDGLLDVHFMRRSGRSGPGAGRPAKFYRRSGREFSVTVPPRRYVLAASILLEAVALGAVGPEWLAAAAHRIGAEMGAEGYDRALNEAGYRPTLEHGDVRFRNCPFHALVLRDRETTCALNLALVEGILAGARNSGTARLAPEEGYCCVRVHLANT